eukprot:GHRR01035376.1.p1 GENE.GHRR01035376.1~~GHRR01035376.1.p1  ORF type:complete len:305 (-),score=98.15 GHRR01035376.1:980-1894(-)
METLRSFQRKRTIKKVQSAAGTRSGGSRHSRALTLRPSDPAAAHGLLADDATPNLRVWQMWEEATGFEGELGRFRGNLEQFEVATDEFVARLEPILRAPLPRVWDSVEGGLAEPVRATVSHTHAHTVGGDASIAGLEETRSEFSNRLRGHVLRPLEQWSEALAVVEERLPDLERLHQRVLKQSKKAARHSARFQASSRNTAAGSVGGGSERAVVPRSPSRGTNGVRGLFGACMHPGVGNGAGVSKRSRSQGRRSGRFGGGGADDSPDTSSEESFNDDDIRREVESEEAGMKLNYIHRKLEGAPA